MSTIKLLLGISAIAWIFSSCSPTYYVPNAHNVPLMDNKGDVALSAGVSEHNGDFQASFAVDDNIGIMINHMGGSSTFDGSSKSTKYHVKGRMTELGAGYFQRINDHLVFEVYALAGMGVFDNKFDSSGSYQGWLTGSANKYALQGNIGLKYKYLELALALKPTTVEFSKVEGTLTIDNESQREVFIDQSQYSFVEHSATLKVGFQGFKLQLQLGSAIDNVPSRGFRTSSFGSLGLLIQINPLKISLDRIHDSEKYDN